MTKRQKTTLPISDAEEARVQQQIASDPDAPELTDQQIAGARPFAEVFPQLAETMRRGRGRPKLDRPKEKITLRLSADVLDHFRGAGDGWQSRIDEALRLIARSGGGTQHENRSVGAAKTASIRREGDDRSAAAAKPVAHKSRNAR